MGTYKVGKVERKKKKKRSVHSIKTFSIAQQHQLKHRDSTAGKFTILTNQVMLMVHQFKKTGYVQMNSMPAMR